MMIYMYTYGTAQESEEEEEEEEAIELLLFFILSSVCMFIKQMSHFTLI